MSANRRPSRIALALFCLLSAGRVHAVEPPREPILTLKGHTSGVFHVTYSLDGKMMATSSKDHTARLWDAATGNLLFTLAGHKQSVYSSSFSPDGKFLATASEDRTLKLWDTTTGKELRNFVGHGEDVYCVQFSPDGTKLASGCSDRHVCIWEVATGNRLQTLQAHSGRVLCVAFSPDGGRLVTSCASNASNASEAAGEVRIWDVAVGKEIYTLPPRNSGVVTVAFSPDGKRLAGSSLKQPIKIWELATGQDSLLLAGHTLETYYVGYSADGRLLASCSGNWRNDQSGELKIWDAATGKEMLSFKPHTAPIWSTAFSPDGKRLASVSGKFNTRDVGEVKVWDISGLPAPPLAMALDAQQLETLWHDLGGTDVPKAYRAVRALSAVPKQSVPFLKDRLRPPVVVAVYERIPKLIADLDDENFEVREKAAKELEQIGQATHPALRKALIDGSAEVKRQAGLLLETRGEAPHLSAEELRMLRAIEVLQNVGTPDVQPALRKLTVGAAEAPVTRDAVLALRRLERAKPK